MVNIIWGTTKKPASSQRLAALFEGHVQDDGDLFIGYPVIATPEGAFSIDALLISPTRGVVIFDLVEGKDLGDYVGRQDESANRLETKLRSHKPLMLGRTLLAVPSVITYAPIINTTNQNLVSHNVANDITFADVLSALNGYQWASSSTYSSVISVIQSISTIRRGKRNRSLAKPDSRGAKLKLLEDSIATLDVIQGRAVIETVEGVQRIRGLAGSGKTIILALKAAYLHSQHPDWKIAVTFNTRSLKEQFRRLINTFVIEQSGDEPNWDNLSIINAWGAPGGREKNGIYYSFCQAHSVAFVDFQNARRLYGQGHEFDGVCKNALAGAKENVKIFDAILVDEAQDFEVSFLQMCYNMLGDIKRLVYAYDELQSLTDRSLPPPEQIFGVDKKGKPLVAFKDPEPGQPQQDIILEKCYRNSRPVLATAHALGFGIYRTPDPKTGTGLIQMFENNHLWEDVGYRVLEGALVDNNRVRLARTNQSSPYFLEEHSPIQDLIQFVIFNSPEDQAIWIANEIEKNLKVDELSYDDIIVINPDPMSTKSAVGRSRRILFEKNINTHLSGVDTSPDVFFDANNESVAFTGIFRAKGNEAGMVYIINAQDCYWSFGSLARVRNQLFTAITRSKAWVRVLGVGDQMLQLAHEFQRVADQQFSLDFVVPDGPTRKYINIINRDLSESEKKNVRDVTNNIKSLVDDINNGSVMIEDLPLEQVEALRQLLSKTKK
ncbi:ATP-binding domain-containing protein [Mesorhizobium sp. LMG17149]|uniref:DEAD/DEAH box helicase n=1 Tax=Mesorhizobium sp. LMG17149 TaxID=2968497 RepID=UPI002117C420|nr:ATP-binding domain-containing protein [Mesorhizobium sp. LMG17149]MCQ8876093.1 ATP-binding domain-containing protein [Mesorhizobium sp. LMG17149]